MWNLIALVAFAVAGGPEVSATRLDGTSIAGSLQSLTPAAVVIDSDDGPQTIEAQALLSLSFAALPEGDVGSPRVELVDGSMLPVAGITTDKSQAKFELATPSTSTVAHASLAVPLETVRAVNLQPLDAAAVPQWREILQLNLPSDVVVVAKQGGKSLDHLECIVGVINEDEVELSVDGQEMHVPRDKVVGIVFYRSQEPHESAAVVLGGNGLRVAAKALNWNGDGLQIQTADGLQFVWPLTDVASIDLSAGKVAFLGDMEPASGKWQPLVGLPASASLAAKYGQPRLNQSGHGGVLSLAYQDSIGSRKVKSFPKGLALRSLSDIVFRLPAGYNRLLAEVGIDPSGRANGNVTLSVFGDDRLLAEHEIDGLDPPRSLDLDVSGVKRLRIVVDYGKNLDTGDWLNLCNARIVK